jgi:FLVCR family feline leukemia virus subgroup C receptor-related protein
MNYSASNDKQKITNSINPTDLTTERIYKVYPRRFAILAIFCICSLSSGFQWIEYVSIQNIIVRYYNQSLPEGYNAKNTVVTWTSLCYMVI